MNLIDLPATETRIHAFGEDWAIAHARRLLQLIEIIAEDQSYDHQAVQWSAYLHDWDAFHQYYLPDCDHAALSRLIVSGYAGGNLLGIVLSGMLPKLSKKMAENIIGHYVCFLRSGNRRAGLDW